MSNLDFHLIKDSEEDMYILVARKNGKFYTTRNIYGIENLIEILDTLPNKACIRLYKISHKKN